jgi:hypothetical protein
MEFKQLLTYTYKNERLFWGGNHGCVWKERVNGGWIWWKYFICTYENRTVKPIKIVFKRGRVRKSNRQGEFHQSTLYACMEISEWNTFVQLIYSDKINYKKEKKMRSWCSLFPMSINCKVKNSCNLFRF